MKLNESQQVAEKRIVRFLSDPSEKEIILDAPSGYGKTTLMNHIVESFPNYRKTLNVLGATLPNSVVFAAPTNKAAAIGFNGGTVHKHLGLVPKKNYSNGKIELSQRNPIMIEAMVADEWSCIGSDVLEYIRKSTKKTIYTGDGCQLFPVKEDSAPVTRLGIPVIHLTEPMRQDIDSGLFKMCQHLRQMVLDKAVNKTTYNDDCVYISGTTMATMMGTHFGADSNNKIITFTNAKAIAINNYIRKLKGITDYWGEGEIVVARNAAFSCNSSGRATVEKQYVVTDANLASETVELDGVSFNVAKNHNQVINAIKKARKQQDFNTMFSLQDKWLDLRSAYAGTCHTAQGSTYDNVFIDLTDFSSCYDIAMLTRLLYVAVSRAKHKVYFYGTPNFNLF